MLSSRELSFIVDDSIDQHLFVVSTLKPQHAVLMQVAGVMCDAILAGKTIYWFGNGGSAADAQHLAAELVGRFRKERRAVASVALTADSSVLTAIANDYGYDEVFSRQLQALCVPGDVAVGISTSGSSANVCCGLQAARALGVFTIGLTGEGGGRVVSIADLCLQVASRDTARIQEAHILCGHILCECLEMAVTGAPELAIRGGAR